MEQHFQQWGGWEEALKPASGRGGVGRGAGGGPGRGGAAWTNAAELDQDAPGLRPQWIS